MQNQVIILCSVFVEKLRSWQRELLDRAVKNNDLNKPGIHLSIEQMDDSDISHT
jgi:hypothetical protein